jgi:prevent-host-death family protein
LGGKNLKLVKKMTQGLTGDIIEYKGNYFNNLNKGGNTVEGLVAVDLGVTTESSIDLDSLDLNTFNSLLLKTNLEHKKFLITEKGKPIAAIVPADEYNPCLNKLNEQELNSLLDEYEEELDRMI